MTLPSTLRLGLLQIHFSAGVGFLPPSLLCSAKGVRANADHPSLPSPSLSSPQFPCGFSLDLWLGVRLPCVAAVFSKEQAGVDESTPEPARYYSILFA